MKKVKTYPSGLRLVVEEKKEAYSVSAGIYVQTGSQNESEKENGISHFVEHLMFKGTPTRTAYDISAEIDRMGSQINAGTSKESTLYYVKSTAEHFKETFDVLADIFLHATFPKEEIERERGVILQEIAMTEDSPEDVCFDLLATAIHGESGIGQTILGPAKNVARFTRDDILAYREKGYVPENVVVSVAGKISYEEAEKICDEYFADFKGFGENAGVKKPSVALAEVPFYTGSFSKSKKIEQVHLAMAFPAFPSFDPRSDRLQLAVIALGDGTSSRLFQEVREKSGLCYSVYASSARYERAGRVECYAAVNPKDQKSALDKIRSVIADFVNTGITEKEFLSAREQMKSTLLFTQESPSAAMRLNARRIATEGKTFDVLERIRDFEGVKIEEINALVKEVFDFKKAAYAVVGNGARPIKNR